MSESPREVRIFVSYSDDSHKHRLQVELMAVELKEAGFSVFLDRLVDDPPTSWPVLIEQELRAADVVLCVCTPTYCERVDGDVPGGTGRGETQEGSMVREEGYDLKMRADRFRVVELQGMAVSVPLALGGKGTHRFQWPKGQSELFEALRRPTKRRTIVEALEQAFVEEVEPLEEWARELVPLGGDTVLDFDKRARRVAYEILRLDDANQMRDALASLADRVGEDDRRPLDQLAKDLDLGPLARSRAQGKARLQPKPSPPKAEPRISDDELDRYLAKARARHEEIQLIGFETTVRASMQLDDLFVPLDAMIDRAGRARDVYAGAQLAEAEKVDAGHLHRQDVPLAEAFGHARAMGKRGVIVLGDPGSGKTTHLKQVLLKIVRDGPESIGLPTGTVPVFLPLRELPRDRSGGLPGFIQQLLQDPFLEAAPDFGARLCQRGKLLLLLDGLDEVADAGERAEVSRWIEASLRAGPESFVLVSCRYAGYTKDVELDAAFLELHLRPLTDEQMTRFVTNWYAVVERAAFTDPRQAEVEAERRTSELLAMLSETEFTAVARVYEMTRNPLLLTAICLVHRDRGRLPKARVRLYEESVKVLLERWRRKFPEAPLPVDQAALVLQPVASWMHAEDQRTRATAAELRAPVQQGLSLLRDVEIDADRFLRAIRDDAGLLTGWSMDEYGFTHLGFQEYLTARWLRSEGLDEPAVLEALAARFGDSWWQEVILLLLALDDPSAFDGLMRAVVRQPEFPQWVESETMALALQEAARPSATPFEELLREGTAAKGWWRGLARWWARTSGGGDGLARRQVAAAELLARAMPEELERLGDLLSEHPMDAVRQWWRIQQQREGRGGSSIVTPSGVELVLIPAGRFTMGEGAEAHEVELESFYLAKTPVTNAQYAKFLEANPGMEKPRFWGDRKWNRPKLPVVGVSWEDAQQYCEWAGMTLPTEAQWEYACRAGTQTRFYSGDTEEDLSRVSWHHMRIDRGTRPVGQKEPNAFGLYDTHGNVWEWCRDSHGSYETSPRTGDGLRHEPDSGIYRVKRGGCWFNFADDTRSAYRSRSEPDSRVSFIGFRPARGCP